VRRDQAIPPSRSPRRRLRRQLEDRRRTPTDPNAKATQAECEQAVTHVLALADAPPDMRPRRDQMISECAETALRHDIDCVLNAKSFEVVGTCPMPGTPK
jgi:hypothetical protein